MDSRDQYIPIVTNQTRAVRIRRESLQTNQNKP